MKNILWTLACIWVVTLVMTTITGLISYGVAGFFGAGLGNLAEKYGLAFLSLAFYYGIIRVLVKLVVK